MHEDEDGKRREASGWVVGGEVVEEEEVEVR